MNDIYTWRATYRDGTVIQEYDETRLDGRGFGETDKTQVAVLELLPSHCVRVPEGVEPVFFRRRSLEFSILDETVSRRGTTHCIGWKQGNKAVYLFVRADGSTLLTDDLQAV